VSEVIQGPDKSPVAFLEHLLEAYRTYTPINPEAEENRRAINIAFTSQSAPNIRKKLQKLEGFEGKLVEIAQRVYNNRDMPEDRQAKRLSKVMVALHKLPPPGPQEVLGLMLTSNLQETPEPHWKGTNELILRKRDTGKMNALRGKGGTKMFSNWSDGARAPCYQPNPGAHGYPSTGGQISQILM
jgi:hypothetical protein